MADEKETIILEFQVDTKDAVTSIDNLTKANKALRDERKNLDLSTEAGKSRVQAINSELDKNTNIIKNNSSALEKQRLNIGNYSGAIDKLIPGLGATIQGFEGMAKSAAAFIATPFGAVIAALGVAMSVLTSFLKFNDEAADQLKATWDGLSEAFVVAEKNAVKLTVALFKILTYQAGSAAEDIKAIGHEMNVAAKEAYNLSLAAADLEDKFAQFNVSELAVKNRIDELILQSKNRSLTEAQRIALNKQASDLEEQQTNKRIDLITKESTIKVAQLVNVHGLQQKVNESLQEWGERIAEDGKLDNKIKNQAVELIRQVDEAQNASIKIQEKLQNQRDALDDKELANQQKILDAKSKADAKYLSDVNKGIQYEQDRKEAAREEEQKSNEEEQARIDAALQKQKDDYDAELDGEVLKQKETTNAKKALDKQVTDSKNEQLKQQMTIAQIGENLIRAAFGQNKEASAALAIIDGIKGYMLSVASYLPPYGEILGLISLAAGAKSAAEIEGVQFAQGGYTGHGGQYDAAGIVHKGEFVMPQSAVNQFGVDHFQSYLDGSIIANASGGSGGSGASPIQVNLGLKEFNEFSNKVKLKESNTSI